MSEITHENQNSKPQKARGLGRGMGALLGAAQEATSSVPLTTKSPNSDIHNGSKSIQAAQGFTETLDKPAPSQASVPPEARIWNVSIDRLSPSDFQPRAHFDKEKLEELAASIKQNGILQPIVARKLEGGKFEIIAGERRWRAAQLAGLHEVPVILKGMEDQAALEVAIIENIQREDLNAIEEAEAFQRLAAEFNLTQQQVAEKVGKDRATVANSMRLLALPTQIREMVIRSEISPGHAKVLLSIQNPTKQLECARRVINLKMSVRQLEKMAASESQEIQGAAASATDSQKAQVTSRLIKGLAEDIQKLIGTKVTIDYADAKGKISIHFYSDEELTQIVEKLKETYGS
jgi:ParB family chromosome partitioning protein